MPPYSLRRLLWGGPAATLLAILVNLSYYGLARGFGERFLMPSDFHNSNLSPLPIAMPVLLTLAAGFLATFFFALLVRFARRPATVFLSVALAALIWSFGGPFNLPSASLQTKLILSGMHILTAVILATGILFFSHKHTR